MITNSIPNSSGSHNVLGNLWKRDQQSSCSRFDIVNRPGDLEQSDSSLPIKKTVI